jgi:hypothetical protein
MSFFREQSVCKANHEFITLVLERNDTFTPVIKRVAVAQFFQNLDSSGFNDYSVTEL